MKISEKTFSFFSTLNQYFPHIPYVASKKIMSKLGVKQIKRKFRVTTEIGSTFFGYWSVTGQVLYELYWEYETLAGVIHPKKIVRGR
jgi:hypothetical protein